MKNLTYSDVFTHLDYHIAELAQQKLSLNNTLGSRKHRLRTRNWKSQTKYDNLLALQKQQLAQRDALTEQIQDLRRLSAGSVESKNNTRSQPVIPPIVVLPDGPNEFTKYQSPVDKGLNLTQRVPPKPASTYLPDVPRVITNNVKSVAATAAARYRRKKSVMQVQAFVITRTSDHTMIYGPYQPNASGNLQRKSKWPSGSKLISKCLHSEAKRDVFDWDNPTSPPQPPRPDDWLTNPIYTEGVTLDVYPDDWPTSFQDTEES